MPRARYLLLVLAAAACTTSGTTHLSAPATAAADLGQGWSAAEQATFYTTGQGSHLLPYAWYRALRRVDSDAAFGADGLARYGYLPSPYDASLPTGFVVETSSGDLGMTCAACHTGSLSYRGTTWRVEGGRAHADFQRFLSDLGAAAQATVASPERLRAFTATVAGPTATPAQASALGGALARWTAGYGDFMSHSLPPSAWGPGRLDAFGMIFNRVTALDLGLAQNYRLADAPVRYPFLWNAAFQDRTQWDGAAPNGSYVAALARNTGEVYGVFARFQPVALGLNVVDYQNSALFRHLQTLEQTVGTLRPPVWPRAVFGLNQAIVPRGAVLFQQNCAACHAARPLGAEGGLWATPVCRVGTDARMYDNALLSGPSGTLGGTLQLAGGGVLHDPDKKVSVLANAVVGSLLRDALNIDTGIWRAINHDQLDPLTRDVPKVAGPPPGELPAECAAAATATTAPPVATDLTGTRTALTAAASTLYQVPASGTAPAVGPAAYEARVLGGIWAAAPYLHNGSVPSLWELLKPPAQRARSFSVGGTEFDPVHVGLAAGQPGAATFTVGDADGGDANTGHAYGTSLSEADRRALVEYLKTL